SDPKGVRHTDGTLLAGGRGLAIALDLSPDDVGSIAFPFTHIAGPDYLVSQLTIGMPAGVVEAFVPGDAVAFYADHGVTTARPRRTASTARCACAARWCARATPTPRSTRTRSTTRAGSAPATSATCGPTGTSCSPAA